MLPGWQFLKSYVLEKDKEDEKLLKLTECTLLDKYAKTFLMQILAMCNSYTSPYTPIALLEEDDLAQRNILFHDMEQEYFRMKLKTQFPHMRDDSIKQS